MDKLSACLLKNGVKFIRIDGETKSLERHAAVNEFQTKQDVRCAILSLKACSAGITMTAASQVIFTELDYTPNTIIQAEGRAHRIGQERPVEIFFLIAPNTADVVLWEMLKAKQRNLAQVGLVGNNEHLSQVATTSKFVAGPSTPHQNLITGYLKKSPPKPENGNSQESKKSSQSFHTCQEFNESDLDGIFDVGANAKPNITSVIPETITKAPNDQPQEESVEKMICGNLNAAVTNMEIQGDDLEDLHFGDSFDKELFPNILVADAKPQEENLDDLIFDDDDDFI